MSLGRRALPRWADWGVIAVAALAAIALAVTVLVARSALRSASEATVRGEGEALLTRLHESAESRRGPPTAASLAAQLDRLRGSGLCFVAFMAPGGFVSAGEATLAFDGLKVGALVIHGGRAMMVSALPGPGGPGGPGHGFPPPPPAGPGVPGAPPPPMGDGRPPPGAGGPGPAVILEFAPTVLPRLESAMDRTVVVGGGAVLVLLAFAAILTLRAVRRAEDERRAEQERRLVALGQMSSVMAHELRNPLASLKGNAQLLAEMLSAGTREHTKAELVVTEAQRLERLTQDLLAFVRDGALSRAHVAPATLLARALDGLPRERIAIDLTGAPPTLWVDESRLAAALGNLVRNGLQSSPADAKVDVRVHARGGETLVEVRDQGKGIAAGDEERIFEPFFTTRVHGTGLGLAVARRAVEQHGGTLRAESPPGGGALFRVVLPAGPAR